MLAFTETPEGVQWLRRILVAAHWCITEIGGGGIRVVDEFLELSGLSEFIAASYGTQQAFHAHLEEHIIACASEQRAQLAAAMPHRTLSLAEDETWKDGMRLVAIDPVSGFILVEQVAEERSAAAWTQALEPQLAGLNVTVVQGTSDEAKGLLAHVQRDLGAHHSTDLFHLQHEASKAMSLSLARAQQQAETEEAKAEAHWQAACAAEQDDHRHPRGPGRPPDFAARTDRARREYVQLSLARAQAEARRTEAKALIAEVSALDHPYDPGL